MNNNDRKIDGHPLSNQYIKTNKYHVFKIRENPFAWNLGMDVKFILCGSINHRHSSDPRNESGPFVLYLLPLH